MCIDDILLSDEHSKKGKWCNIYTDIKLTKVATS